MGNIRSWLSFRHFVPRRFGRRGGRVDSEGAGRVTDGRRWARWRSARGGVDSGTNFLVLFEMLNPYKLTSLKVIQVETNKLNAPEHILWHLVSTNGSDPVKTFFYGRNIQGMASYLPGVNAEPLSPHVKYRLDLEAADKLKGSLDFQTIELPE